MGRPTSPAPGPRYSSPPLCAVLDKEMNSDGHVHNLASSLVEIFSVEVHTNSHLPKGQTHLEVSGYGAVFTDSSKIVYDLFDRGYYVLEYIEEEDDEEEEDEEEEDELGGETSDVDRAPELVRPGDSLILSCNIHSDPPFIPSAPLEFRMHLWDQTRGLEIANGKCLKPLISMHEFDHLQIAKVEGKDGFALVHYTTFKAASIACLDHVYLVDDSSSPLKSADVYGTIVVRCIDTSGGGEKYPPVVLFRKDPKKCVSVEAGGRIDLTRNRWAVPTHCYFLLEMDLWDDITNKSIGYGLVEVHPRRSEDWTRIGSIEFMLGWSHAYRDQPRRSRYLERVPVSPRIVKYQPRSALVEIYSIMIGACRVESDDDFILGVWGSITVTHYAYSKCEIFHRDERNPELLSEDDMTLSSIVIPCSFMCAPFLMHLNLKDDRGCVISKGSLAWGPPDDNGICTDRRLCSVVCGDPGCYARVHYSIFENAAPFLVRVRVRCRTASKKMISMHGHVASRYDNYNYSSDHACTSYRSMLFKANKNEAAHIRVSDDQMGEIVSTRNVAVPLDSRLIVDVNVWVAYPWELIKESVSFGQETIHVIEGERFDVIIEACCEESASESVPSEDSFNVFDFL